MHVVFEGAGGPHLDVWGRPHVAQVLPQSLSLPPAHVCEMSILIDDTDVVISLSMPDEVYVLQATKSISASCSFTV